MELQTVQVQRSYTPEESNYTTVVVDITHRCNMTCANCYVPNREIPDLDTKWMLSIFDRLKRGTFVRLMGGEPTLRRDLPDLIHELRVRGLHPVLVTNGLKLADRKYLRSLKDAGLQLAALSFSGGFEDDLYEAIDEMRCAERKIAAFENLRAEHIFTSIGMLMVRGINEGEVGRVLAESVRSRNVREFHLRSIGPMGRFMEGSAPFKLAELLDIFARAAGIPADSIEMQERTESSYDFTFRRLRVQLTQWPDLGSATRGRLTPEGLIAPAMEHIIANDGGY